MMDSQNRVILIILIKKFVILTKGNIHTIQANHKPQVKMKTAVISITQLILRRVVIISKI